jgi:hypothetical protein
MAALWLGNEYHRPWVDDHIIPKNLVSAWAWYDIAAALKAREVAKLPPASSPQQARLNSNDTEIGYRDSVAKEMTPDQIAEALSLSQQWQRQHVGHLR